nr:DUF2179 domain-containing protein [Mycoplasma sp. NEAQ87857]
MSHIEKKNTVYKRTKMSNFGLKLNSLYSQMSMFKIIRITIISAIFFGIISVFFVKNVGIYNFGLAAFGQSFARILTTVLKEDQVSIAVRNLIDQFVFWIAYIILSIPIFIFGYKKIGKVFTNITVLFLVVSSVVSFSIGLIPGANNIYLIGNFDNNQIKAILPEYKKPLSGIIPLLWNDGGNIIALMIYSIAYGYMLAYVFAIIQIIGGTAGVTGVIGEWYANEKQKSFGSISGYMNIIIVFISVLVGSWLPGSLLLKEAQTLEYNKLNLVLKEMVHSNANVKSVEALINSIESGKVKINNGLDTLSAIGELKDYVSTLKITSKAWTFELYLSPNFVATVLTNIVYIIVLNKLYPKFKLVRLEIFSNKCEEIQSKINKDKKIVTGMTIFSAKGGYTGEPVKVVTSIALFRHVVRIMKDVRKVDSEAFISVSDVSSIDGFIYLPEDKF